MMAECRHRAVTQRNETMAYGAASLGCVGLDLDACIPQWMRDNFDHCVQYPSLALGACDQYVDTKLKAQSSLQTGPNIAMTAIVSFSFVNTDL